MFNDIDWTKIGNCTEAFFSNFEVVRYYAKRFQLGHCSSLGLGEEDTGTERKISKLKDSGIKPRMSWSSIS